jgi:hypothetical protein
MAAGNCGHRADSLWNLFVHERVLVPYETPVKEAGYVELRSGARGQINRQSRFR